MINFTFCVPTKFVFGKGVEKQTGAELKALGVKKVLIHYGGGSVIRSGLMKVVTDSLEAEGIEYVSLGGGQLPFECASDAHHLLYRRYAFAVHHRSETKAG